MRIGASLVAIVVVLAVTPPAVADSSADFTRRAFATGVDPQAAALADVNEDGRLDLLASVGLRDDDYDRAFSRGIAVLPGDPDAGLGLAKLSINALDVTESFVVVDLDGDAHLDVLGLMCATECGDKSETKRVVVIPGQGDGTFGQPKSSINLLPKSYAIAAGNLLPGDETEVALSGPDGISLYRGAPGFTFTDLNQQLTSTPSDLLAAADLDGDGDQELVAATGNQVQLYDGTTNVVSSSLPGLVSLEVASVDDSEVVVGTGSAGDVAAWGDGLQRVAQAVGNRSARTATVADLDGNGELDVARANTDATVSIFLNGGAEQRTAVSRTAVDILASDLTGDGIPDVIAIEQKDQASIAEVLENDGTGKLPAQRPVVGTQANAWDVATADFNNDGRDDLVASQWLGYIDGVAAPLSATVYINGPSGFARTATVDTTGAAVSGTSVGDVNGDGSPDILTTEYYTGAVSQYLGVGDGTFGTKLPATACGYFGDGLAVGDFNADGYDDVAVACRSLIYRDEIAVLLGSPAGLVRGPATLVSLTNNQIFAMRTGDINGDGNVDLAIDSFDHFETPCQPTPCITARTGSAINYFLGLGNGLFDPTEHNYVSSRFYGAFELADMNKDGRDDIVLTHTYEDEVAIVPGKADGTLDAALYHPTPDYPTTVTVGDVDGDGYNDVVMAHGPMMVSLMYGRESGFKKAVGYATRSWVGTPLIFDATGDGHNGIAAGEGFQFELLLKP